jgi:hypothetical protein
MDTCPGSLASNLDSEWHLTWIKPAYRSKSWLGVVLVAIQSRRWRPAYRSDVHVQPGEQADRRLMQKAS